MPDHKTPVPAQGTKPASGSPAGKVPPKRFVFPPRPLTDAGRYGPPAKPAAAGGNGGEEALRIFVAEKESHPSGADLLAPIHDGKRDQYGFPLPAPQAKKEDAGAQPSAQPQPAPAPEAATAQPAAAWACAPQTREAAPTAEDAPASKPEAHGGFFKVLRGARVEFNTIQGVCLEDLGYAEKVPRSDRKEALHMLDGSPHKFSGFEVQLRAQGGSRKFMFSNTPPDVLADHGATGYLVTSDYMKVALADGRVVYIIEVCKDASTFKLTDNPREGASEANGHVPLFDNSSEAVRWIARKEATDRKYAVKKQIIKDGQTIVLLEAPEISPDGGKDATLKVAKAETDKGCTVATEGKAEGAASEDDEVETVKECLIITDGKVEAATSRVAKAFETAKKRMLITIDLGNSNSTEARLQSGETIKVKVIPVSTRMSRKPLSLPPSPMGPKAAQPAVSPSATGTTEASVLISLDVGLPRTEEDAAALLKAAIMPTPAPVLHGDEGAKAAFDRKRRFLTSISQGITSVTEHNDAADPLVFTEVRTKIGGLNFIFNLYRLKSDVGGLSPALRGMEHSFAFTDSENWYILMPPLHVDMETRKLLLESTMTR